MSEDSEHLVVSAPGKVILHGEHAVVHGKRALACSLNLRTFLHVRKSKDGMVRMSLPDIEIYQEWTTDDIRSKLSQLKTDLNINPTDPSQEVVETICEFCSIDPATHNTKQLATVAFIYLYITILPDHWDKGLDFMLSSNLPTSAGLGSSAAFSVCLVASLLRLSGVISDPGKDSFNVWNSQDKFIINEWAYIAEKIIHGNPSGVDNSVSTYGGIVKYQNKTVERLESVKEFKVLITNTKVPRSTKQMVLNVGTKLLKYKTIIEPVMDAIEAISVRCQSELCGEQDMDEQVIKDLIEANHYLLCVLGVNHPALEKVCRVTHDHGLVSKLTGAGGGGCAFTLLPSGIQESTLVSVKEELTALGFDCWQTVVGGPGVGLHFGQPNDDFTIPHALKSRAMHCNIL